MAMFQLHFLPSRLENGDHWRGNLRHGSEIKTGQQLPALISPWPSSPAWGSIWYRIRRAHGDSFYTTLYAIDYHREFALWFVVAGSSSLERVKSASEITPRSFNSDTCHAASLGFAQRRCTATEATLFLCFRSILWITHLACVPLLSFMNHNHLVARTFQYFSIGSHCSLFNLIKIFFQTCWLYRNQNGARMLMISTSRQVAPCLLVAWNTERVLDHWHASQ